VSLTADEKQRFLSSLRSDEAFREEVRRELLTSELLALPQRFAAFVDEVHAFVDEVHAFVEATDRRLAALEQRVGRLEDGFGELRGEALELQVRQNPGYYLHKFARRVKVLSLEDVLDDPAVPALSDAEQDILARTGVLARGIRRESGVPVLLLVEATWRPHTGDVERQVTRRDVLAGKGVETLAVIVSRKAPTPAVARFAEANEVLVEAVNPEEPPEAA
jgi:hypothetical protein